LAGPAPEYSWFFRDQYRAVLRAAYLILGDAGRAEEITQEAFVQLLVHWRKVSRYERPEAWVRRVAIRLAVRASRRDRLRTALEGQAQARGDAQRPPDVDLADALGSLSVRQRACVLLFYVEDRPIAEVAQILGISEGSAKTHLHRARQRLATLLREEVDEDAR
jgi:RNA polymerase sigma-70 factor (ECF subfamily)